MQAREGKSRQQHLDALRTVKEAVAQRRTASLQRARALEQVRDLRATTAAQRRFNATHKRRSVELAAAERGVKRQAVALRQLGIYRTSLLRRHHNSGENFSRLQDRVLQRTR